MLIALPDSAEFVATFLGTLLAGAVAVPCNTFLGYGDYRYFLAESRAAVFVTTAAIAHALAHRSAAVDYALQFGRGLGRTDTDRLVGMYVNGLTLDYGPRGRTALARFFGVAFDRGLIPAVPADTNGVR